jgi:iron complex transport system ATP-binding protein
MSARVELMDVGVRRGAREVLAGVSMAVTGGELLGLVGPNGAGKTTLLRAALGLQPLATGEARLDGRPIARMSDTERAAVAGYLPQERRVAWNMPARDIAALGAPDAPPAERRRLAEACLDELEVGDLAGRGVLDMSGGERARVLLARLLATRAKVLIADEPAAGLDPEAQLLILERLKARASAGAAVIVTSHDLGLAARTCDRLAVLHRGRLVALGAPAQALSPAVLGEVFALEGALVDSAVGLTLAARRRGASAPN